MDSEANSGSKAQLWAEPHEGGELALRFEGRLDVHNAGAIWRQATHAIAEHPPVRLKVDAAGITYCDGAGVGLLFELARRGLAGGYPVAIEQLKPEFQRLLDQFDVNQYTITKHAARRSRNIPEEVGEACIKLGLDLWVLVVFIGELFAALLKTVLRPFRVRWTDLFRITETAGANAIGIIILIGFLFGLILAFSSAIPLKQFGAEIYVADLVAIALVRVLGPFITAIILAGRSGSAFAAELGTMKINEELDALTIMGMDPIRFLVVPRVVATAVMTPLLAVVANLAGLIGSAVVVLSMGFPLVTYLNRIQSTIAAADILGGLFKAFVFGILVSAVSCLRGLQTGYGASAVGAATTKAVVSSIVLIVVAEGIFAILFFRLGI